MAEVKRRPDMETKESPFCYEYKCSCGKIIFLMSEDKPERLFKCWDCL